MGEVRASFYFVPTCSAPLGSLHSPVILLDCARLDPTRAMTPSYDQPHVLIQTCIALDPSSLALYSLLRHRRRTIITPRNRAAPGSSRRATRTTPVPLGMDSIGEGELDSAVPATPISQVEDLLVDSSNEHLNAPFDLASTLMSEQEGKEAVEAAALLASGGVTGLRIPNPFASQGAAGNPHAMPPPGQRSSDTAEPVVNQFNMTMDQRDIAILGASPESGRAMINALQIRGEKMESLLAALLVKENAIKDQQKKRDEQVAADAVRRHQQRLAAGVAHPVAAHAGSSLAAGLGLPLVGYAPISGHSVSAPSSPARIQVPAFTFASSQPGNLPGVSANPLSQTLRQQEIMAHNVATFRRHIATRMVMALQSGKPLGTLLREYHSSIPDMTTNMNDAFSQAMMDEGVVMDALPPMNASQHLHATAIYRARHPQAGMSLAQIQAQNLAELQADLASQAQNQGGIGLVSHQAP